MLRAERRTINTSQAEVKAECLIEFGDERRGRAADWPAGRSTAVDLTCPACALASPLCSGHERHGVDLDRRPGQDEARRADRGAGRQVRAEDLAPHAVVALVVVERGEEFFETKVVQTLRS
jgi:hypothetical protein